MNVNFFVRQTYLLLRNVQRNFQFVLSTKNYSLLSNYARFSTETSIASRKIQSPFDEELNAFVNKIVRKNKVSNSLKGVKYENLPEFFLRTSNIGSIKRMLLKFKSSLNATSSSAALSQLSVLAYHSNSVPEVMEWLQKNMLNYLERAYDNDKYDPSLWITSLKSLISLDLYESKLGRKLIGQLEQLTSIDLMHLPINPIVQFYMQVKMRNLKLSESIDGSFEHAVSVRISEIESPELLLAMLSRINLNEIQVCAVLDQIKKFLPKMSLSELVSLLTNLAQRNMFYADILPLIAAALNMTTTRLKGNELAALAQAASSLRFTDARLLRKLTSDLRENIDDISNWSYMSRIIVSFSKLRLSNKSVWKTIAKWINANYMGVSDVDLSFALTGMVTCGMSDLISVPLEHSAKIANIEASKSAVIWLNRVHALAMGNALTSKLAETVLREDFINQVIKDANAAKRMILWSKLVQIQASAMLELSEGYLGENFDFTTIFPTNDESDRLAFEIKYGRKKAYEAQCFHDLIYKLAPLKTHSAKPSLNSDAIFIDALVKVDVSQRFVPLSKETSADECKLAIIYLTGTHLTHTFESNDEPLPIGYFLFCRRLLEKRGVIPVFITDHELRVYSSLPERLEFIKMKLIETAQQRNTFQRDISGKE